MYELISFYEGEKLEAYWDKIGKCWTIGVGITKYPDGTPVKKGDVITKEKSEALLRDYCLKNVLPHLEKIPYKLTENQKDALCSLIYNVGWSKVSKSNCWKSICNKDYGGIFNNWNWGVSQAKGLAKRRAKELDLFLADL